MCCFTVVECSVPICKKSCPYGYERDENQCQTCECFNPCDVRMSVPRIYIFYSTDRWSVQLCFAYLLDWYNEAAQRPDLGTVGHEFYRHYSSIFFRQLPSELTEWNSTKTDHMLGNEWDLKMHVRNLGYTLLLQIGGLKITFYRRLRNFIATVSACIFGMKDDTHNWVSALENTRGLHSWAPIGMGKGGTCPPWRGDWKIERQLP